MATAKSHIVNKHFRLDSIKLKRAQKVLEAATETETVERALEFGHIRARTQQVDYGSQSGILQKLRCHSRCSWNARRLEAAE